MRDPYLATKAERFKKNYRSVDYLRKVQALPCCVCRSTPSEAHHYPSRGAGGGWRDLTPLCPSHHREFHDSGQRTFQQTYGLYLSSVAKTVYLRLLEVEPGGRA